MAMQLGSKAKAPPAELTDDEVYAIARDVSERRAAANLASEDPREATTAALDALAASASGPIAEALTSLSAFSKGEWPEGEELASLRRLGHDLSTMNEAQEAVTEDAMTRVAEAETMRAQLSQDMSRFIAAAASGDESTVGRMQARVDALETQLGNMQSRLERRAHAQPERASDDGTGGGASAAQQSLVNELRARVSRLESDNGNLRRRLEGVEAQMAHIERILEAAAGFAAAEEQGPAGARGGSAATPGLQ
jgi:uncharacterized protein YceH (UPF0502 family)